MSIHVLCLNPAVDKLYWIDGFAPGEVYTGQTPRVSAGGKGVNVARVLCQLGEAPRLYAFLGERGGEEIEREMGARCDCAFVRVPGSCRTTLNVVDRASGRETVVSEAGPRVDGAHVKALEAALEENVRPGDLVCCSGSVIAGAPEDIYARVSRLCGALGARCVLDCNAKALGASLKDARYALGKPNARELADHLRLPETTDPREVARMARKLTPPYEALLVSMGARGGVLVGKDGAFAASVPPVRVVSTVGCGDASLAGALYAMARGMDAKEMLCLSMACGAACAAGERPGSVEKEDVERFVEKISVYTL